MRYRAKAGSLIGIAEQVHALGGNFLLLLESQGLEPGALNHPDLYLPYETLAELVEAAASMCGAADFGIRLGNAQGLEVLGALGSALCLQNSVADAMRLVSLNLDFHARGISTKVSQEGSFVVTEFVLEFAHLTETRQLMAMSIGQLISFIRHLHSREAGPERVDFAFDALGCEQSYQTLCGCPVHFNQPSNRVLFPMTTMSLPVSVDAEQRQRLSHGWLQPLSPGRNAAEPILSEQVERAMAALIPTGECSLSLVAKLVGLHPRSLQKQLKSAGLNYGELLQRVRLKLAQKQLASEPMDLTRLALQLGYAELAVFSRAFRVWTGQSPSEWIQQSQNR